MFFAATVITLYPQMFPGMLGQSLAGKGLEKGLWSLEVHDIRKHGLGKHLAVDDTPSGGGPGMVLRPDVLAAAIDSAIESEDNRPRVVMSARGVPFNQKMAREWSAKSGIILICGRFEGIDQRVIDSRNLLEVSIGDYILSGGEAAAHVVLDATVRLLPGIMGNSDSSTKESFEGELLEYPQFTRPHNWENHKIPPVLTSGNHAEINTWQRREAEKLTMERRPDLWEKYLRKNEQAEG